jgi:predicted GNAT family acetyltransferase
MEEIVREGKTPFLHSFADNYGAIRVYESLGFTLRQRLELAVVQNRWCRTGNRVQVAGDRE